MSYSIFSITDETFHKSVDDSHGTVYLLELQLTELEKNQIIEAWQLYNSTICHTPMKETWHKLEQFDELVKRLKKDLKEQEEYPETLQYLEKILKEFKAI